MTDFTYNGFKVVELDSFPTNSNPFHHDSYNMGQQIGTNITAMFANHSTEKMRYLILVDNKTGKRVKIFMPSEPAAK